MERDTHEPSEAKASASVSEPTRGEAAPVTVRAMAVGTLLLPAATEMFEKLLAQSGY
jgi:hypothetical protein